MSGSSFPPSEEAVGRPSGSQAPLAMETETFRSLAHDLVDRIADLLASVPERPVTPGESPEAVRASLKSTTSLPADGSDPSEVLGSATELLFAHSLFNGHPRFFGYITSSPARIGMLGDLLAASVNPNVGGWTLAPMATEMEAQAVRWVGELIGYPEGAGGLFVSGGNMANFVAFLAARTAAGGQSVRAQGLARGDRLRVYASAETHTWIQKAADLFGLGADAIHWIRADESLRMDIGELRAALEDDRQNGERPMMVVGTAGSVSTGAVDPLYEIAEVCREAGTWFHVDGAYGGFAARVPGVPRDLQALRLADSVAVDPHKWLYSPLEAGCVLVRDPETLRNAFSYHPPYYHFGDEATNYFDLGPQNSRGFRALKVWLGLRQAGRSGCLRMIGDDIRLSERLSRLLSAHSEFEALTQALSITTFRYVPPDLRQGVGIPETEAYLNHLNEQLLDRIQRSGEAFVSNALIRGRYALRACIVNFNTTGADVDALPEIVARHGRELDGSLRTV
jgi:aromatic-L-amino-acid/L-tryptophan decarboxylase